MIREIADPVCLKEQAAECRKKKFSPGLDKMDMSAALVWLEVNGEELSARLRHGSYRPLPALGFRSAKRDGGYRQFVRLSALDTVIQKNLMRVIGEKCEQSFSDSSFAYRKDRGTIHALARFCELGNTYPMAVRLDPTACFDNLDHEFLRSQLEKIIDEQPVVSLMMRYAELPVWIDGECVPTEKGILQGMPLSTLLCNLYFDAMDKYLESAAVPFIRYADDLVLFAESEREAERVRELASTFLKSELKLTENRKKTLITSPARMKFLGRRFDKRPGGLTAIEDDNSELAAYYNWHEGRPEPSHPQTDLVEDGILRQKDYSLMLETDVGDLDIPVSSTGVINIYSNVVFDSGFLRSAMEKGIFINLFDKNNHLIGRFLPNAALKNPLLTDLQLDLYNNPAKRLWFAKKILLASLHNTRLVIRYYRKTYGKIKGMEVFTNALDRIDAEEDRIPAIGDQTELLAAEARIREAYYGCYDSFLLVPGFTYGKRSRRPPENEINALLSFGNTVLYNLLAVEINKTSLDIRIGLLHATGRREESLNLDLAEIFKPLVVDRTVFGAVNLKAIGLEHFRHEENGGVYLTEEGKRQFLRCFYDKLDTVLTVKNEKVTYTQLIRREIQGLIRSIQSGELYAPYKQVR